MAVNPQAGQTSDNQAIINEKEYNFDLLRKQKEREIQALREELDKTKKLAQEALSRKAVDDDDNDDEPYVDHKKLDKKFTKFEERIDQKIEEKSAMKAQAMFDDYQKGQWVKNNPDFYDVMKHAEVFANTDSEFAETILKMPEGFERNKLVYKSIKAMGLHKPPELKSNVQDKIDANRRAPFYQPSGVGAPPYGVVNGGKDYSPAQGKSAYDKMKAMQAKLRLG